jgi:uncharacterized protein
MMRRADRRIGTPEARELVAQATYGVLSTVGPDGAPYGVPLSFCLAGSAIYIHSAREGRKLDHLAREPRVSFCVVGATEVLPQQFGTLYESCIVEGVAAEAFGEEKQAALEGLVAKYAAGFPVERQRHIEALGDETRVFRIDVVSLSGKARRA